MKAIWLLGVGLVAAFFAVSAADACACIDVPGLACTTVSADDKDPEVQHKFGAMFRDGFAFAATCSDEFGPSRYLFTTKTVKGGDGVCRYRQEEYYAVASDGKYFWFEQPENGTDVSRSTGSFVTRSKGNCPEKGDPLYKRGTL